MFHVRFVNFGHGLETPFATLAAALAAGKARGFEFAVDDAAGTVAGWSPIGGTRYYRQPGLDPVEQRERLDALRARFWRAETAEEHAEICRQEAELMGGPFYA